MASSTGRSDRPTRQDYVARIRYVNNLPPPPNPPKLLNIPGTGLPNDHYTDPSFASRLIRDQPINVEADAELGMPIDLVGMPGVFDGDESCISALPEQPIPHPHDEPLLKPLSALRKADTSAVSFLRRTDIMGSSSGMGLGGGRDSAKSKAPPKRKHDDISRDDPARIVRDIEQSFTLANAGGYVNGDAAAASSSRQAWAEPKHPKNPQLQLVDSYPILPDLDATPDAGSYSVTKFNTNPVSFDEGYDERLDVAVLLPRDPKPEVMQLHRSKQAERIEKGLYEERIPFQYDLFLAKDKDLVGDIKYSISDPSVDGQATFEFPRIRAYETVNQSGNQNEPYDDTIALALYDGSEETEEDDAGGVKKRKLTKGAYFYPISVRNLIRAARGGIGFAGDLGAADVLDVSFRAPTEDEVGQRQNAILAT